MNVNKLNYLVSVRTKEESLIAYNSGADYIDIKDPSKGSLGVANLETVVDIVTNLKKTDFSGLISTTFENTMSYNPNIEREIFLSYLLSGIDLLKIGIKTSASGCENFFNYFCYSNIFFFSNFC